MSTLFFIMLGFLAGRLTADELPEIKEEANVVSTLLQRAYAITAYQGENPEQNHQNMLLAAALLKKVAEAKVVSLPVQQLEQEPQESLIEEIIDEPQDIF